MKLISKLIIILGTLHICRSYARQPNVGSVLFSPNDLLKHRWTQSELASLRARRYFQNLIPPPKHTHSISDEYLSHLVNYVNNCYTTVLNEADNPKEKDLMTDALSDVVGGYLKVWVLPISKYAYYGGTISPINAIKLFQMYDDIKKSLKTDGRNWKNPNEDSLQTITINIASNPHEWFTRSTRESCDKLSYYEKTDKGLTIPLPYINWDLYPQTMFIPLKDQSLIQLNSPNSSNALLDYYNVATSCIHSLNMGTIDDFGSRFQIWLSTDVVPHLNDDDLYVAFGSCLSLLNKTKGLYGNMVNLCDNAYSNLRCKAASAGYPFPLTKKSMLIAFILLIEVVWCIPVLYYLLCGKKSKKKRGVKRFFTYFKKDPSTLHGVKLFVKPRTRNLELDVEFPTYDHKYYMKSTSTNVSQHNVLNNVTHVNEPLKEFSKKPIETKIINSKVDINDISKTNIKKSSNKCKCNCKSLCNNKSSSYFVNSQTMNNITHDNSTPSSFLLEENEIKNLSYTHAILSVSKSTLKSTSNMQLCSKLKPGCPCTRCINNVTEKNVQIRQRLENVEKTNIKVKSPIVMKIINEDRMEANSSCEKHEIQKFQHIRTNSMKTKQSENVISSNPIKENKIMNYSSHKKADKPMAAPITLPVTKNNTCLSEKITCKTGATSKDKIGIIKVGTSDNNKLLTARENKQQIKSLKNVMPSIKTNNTNTAFINTTISAKVSTRDKSAIAEVPKENKITQNNISDKQPVVKLMQSTKTEVANRVKADHSVKSNEIQKRIPKIRSTVPKLSNLPPRTNTSTEQGKKILTVKPCKIPKRINTTTKDLKQPIANSTSPKTLANERKKALDDSAIKKTREVNKLNTTF